MQCGIRDVHPYGEQEDLIGSTVQAQGGAQAD